jgi:von Willebrand factor A domain-containing protein 8
MKKAGIGELIVDDRIQIDMAVTNDHVIIGDLCVKRSVPVNIEKVPRPLFYDNPAHRFALESMLRTHISDRYNSTLLIGNQGVGKNKLVDQMLHMLRREREYIQLHRDSTVQSLTMVPTLQDGRVIFEDSPLLKAAKTGRVLVIDEADKAPIEVLCLLKMLAEDGELILHDGRRLLSQQRISHEFPEGCSSNDIIPINPDFRLIVLANRPGYPFHGNNLFRECGDIFSVQVIENLDLSSEITLLNAYGPNVPMDVIRRIALAFQDLRSMYENHELSYPYSAREAVSVVKHIQNFPEDGAAAAVENILGFDGYNPRSRKTIALVFQSRGIPVPIEQNLSAPPTNHLELIQSMIKIAPSVPIPEPVRYDASLTTSSSPLTPCGVSTRSLVIKPWTSNSFSTRSFPIHPARVFSFRSGVSLHLLMPE